MNNIENIQLKENDDLTELAEMAVFIQEKISEGLKGSCELLSMQYKNIIVYRYNSKKMHYYLEMVFENIEFTDGSEINKKVCLSIWKTSNNHPDGPYKDPEIVEYDYREEKEKFYKKLNNLGTEILIKEMF